MRVLGGRYRIDAAAGAGGMGEVWRATDLELERTVAVKVLPAALAADPEFRSRFRREARLLGGLRHEGIAVLHDVGEDGGEPFLVMEFVEGRTLARVTGGRPVDCEWALAVVRQLAAALGYSHAQGLIHRDVKPSNVMITASGGVRILDFGISKALSGSSTRLTGTGTSLGTPAYMSPEQIDGESVDIRTDQYALGCLLHELLTGRPPFVGDSPFAVLNQHLTKQPVGPSRFNGLVPASVDVLVLRLLAKAPDGRFRDMAEFVRALDHVQVLAQAAVPVSVPGTPSDSAPDSTAAGPVPDRAPRRAPRLVRRRARRLAPRRLPRRVAALGAENGGRGTVRLHARDPGGLHRGPPNPPRRRLDGPVTGGQSARGGGGHTRHLARRAAASAAAVGRPAGQRAPGRGHRPDRVAGLDGALPPVLRRAVLPSARLLDLR